MSQAKTAIEHYTNYTDLHTHLKVIKRLNLSGDDFKRIIEISCKPMAFT